MAIRVLSCLSLSLLLPILVLADDPEPPNPQAAKAKARVLKLKDQKAVTTTTTTVLQLSTDGKATAVLQLKATQSVKKTTKAQKDAAKKLLEATKAASAAAKEYVAARTALAKSAAEKKAAEKRFADAAKKYQETRKVVTDLSNPKRLAAQLQILRGRLGRTTGGYVRTTVDPKDPIERFALLTPSGPVVIEAAITVAGKPFRVAREKLVDEYLATADANNDGEATWDEALKSARFTSRRVPANTSDDQRKQIIGTLDTNADNLVDRDEVRRFLAMFFQGPAFTLSAGSRYAYGRGVFLSSRGRTTTSGQADVRSLLDVDKDGILSKEEIAAAGQRLKSRDADGNDLLIPSELAGNVRTSGRQNYSPQPQTQLTVLLGPTAKPATLFQALQQRYKNEQGDIVATSFSAVPKLFEKLDKNQDGKLQQNEVMALNTVEPHLNLEVSLGQTEGFKGLKIKAIAAGLSASAKQGETLSIELPGIKLSLAANLTAARVFNYDRTAQALITRYDKDGNKYLEKNELPTGNVATQFDLWDADNDGKVFAKEIAESYTRMQAPQMSQIRCTPAMQGNILFQALDLSGEGRLSLREMRTAHKRIMSFDKNKDGRVTQSEIPVSLSMTFGRGTAGYSYVAQGSRRTRAGATRQVSNGAPKWFISMDRNGDGDVTIKEFLGSNKQFEKLDTNNDTFIELEEAKAAKSDLE